MNSDVRIIVLVNYSPSGHGNTPKVIVREATKKGYCGSYGGKNE